MEVRSCCSRTAICGLISGDEDRRMRRGKLRGLSVYSNHECEAGSAAASMPLRA